MLTMAIGGLTTPLLRAVLLRVLLLAPLLLPASSAMGSPWQKIAAEGESDPDGRPYGYLILASRISDDGAVSFADVAQDPVPSPPRYSLWRWSEAAGAAPLATIDLPAGPAGTMGDPRFPLLESNAAGDLAWRDGAPVSLVDCGEGASAPQARERLFVLPSDGSVAVKAATGTPAPGAAGATLARLLPSLLFPPPARSAVGPDFLLGADASASFRAELADGPCFADSPMAEFSRALFAPDADGFPTKIAREGEPLPGAAAGELMTLEEVAFAEAGAGTVLARVGFRPEGSFALHSALLRWRPPAVEPEILARTDEPSPFFGGAWLASFGELRASPGGAVALAATRHESEPAPLGGRGGIWIGDADGLEEAFPLTGPVPGGPPETTFSESSRASSVVVNSAGEVAFHSHFLPATGPLLPDGAFGPGADGTPTLRLASGDPAPGAGGLFLRSPAPLHLAPDGSMLVRTRLSETPHGFTEAAPSAWYLVPRNGAPRLLLRSDQPIEIAPGDLRTLSYAIVAHDAALTRIAVQSGLGSSEPTAIAVRAVPEPGTSAAASWAIAALGVLASLRRRARPPASPSRHSAATRGDAAVAALAGVSLTSVAGT